MRKLVNILLLSLLIVSCLGSQQLSTGLSSAPHFYIPVGTKADNYNFGMGVNLEGLFSLARLNNFSAGVDLNYAFVPLDLGQPFLSTDTNLSLISMGVALRAAYPMGERFSVFAKAGAGGCASVLHGNDSGQAFGFSWNSGAGVGFLFNKQLALQAAVSYVSHTDIYDGMAINIGVNTRFSGPGSSVIPREDFVPTGPGVLPGGGNIQLMDAELTKVFPVLYKFYATHPIGTATVVNNGKDTIRDAEIRLETAQFMDAPILSARIDQMKPGEEQTIDLYALFTEEILSITEGTKLASEITVTYIFNGAEVQDTGSVMLDTWHRNALIWDDDRKVAAFVTARDEEIQKIARNVASMVRDEGLAGFSSEFQLAMALLGAMDVFGCTYVVDPSSSYSDLSEDATSVDTIQFPRQTLQYRAGDCDDLSSTYNAMLEAVGVESAFITVPGHIYSAFKLNMSEAEAKRSFSRFQDLIFSDEGEVWVPIETTALQEGLLNAWALGSRQWRENESASSAELIPVREAWQTYEPVAFGVSKYEIEIPDRIEVSYLFSEELTDFINQEISSRERRLLARIDRDPSDKRSLNSLGVLYARYGKNEEARNRFEEAAPHPAALLNLGNLAYLDDNLGQAGSYYQQALNLSPEYPAAVLGVARVAHAQEDFETARGAYEQLKSLSPELANRFAYLSKDSPGEVTRASSDAMDRRVVLWDEE
jgi:hypothetical protein